MNFPAIRKSSSHIFYDAVRLGKVGVRRRATAVDRKCMLVVGGRDDTRNLHVDSRMLFWSQEGSSGRLLNMSLPNASHVWQDMGGDTPVLASGSFLPASVSMCDAS